MNWDSVKSAISDYAPLLGTLVGGPTGSVVAMVASALGTDTRPESIEQAIKSNPQAGIKLLELEEENRASLEQMAINSDLEKFKQTHQTIRAELATDDKFKSYWRPAFGYAVVLTWLLTWVAICYVVIFDTSKAIEVMSALTSTTTLWGVALAVLGVQITKRSQDKQVVAGQAPKGIIEGLTSVFRKS